MPKLLVNLDVDDIERAVEFYTQGIGLQVGRRFDNSFVELLGADVPLYLLAKSAGSAPFADAAGGRSYARHWTPLHLDFVVDDLDAALELARNAGATFEGGVSEHAYGRLALGSDPFGHGFCLLEFRGRGYDELAYIGKSTDVST
jgi:catechol 2,3-dioxygenase-like lactoylglutathione lyase family enzyme